MFSHLRDRDSLYVTRDAVYYHEFYYSSTTTSTSNNGTVVDQRNGI